MVDYHDHHDDDSRDAKDKMIATPPLYPGATILAIREHPDVLVTSNEFGMKQLRNTTTLALK